MKRFCYAALFVMCAGGLMAQAVREDGKPPPPASTAGETALAITRVALFSSGVGFFERGGAVSGAVSIALPFNAGVIDDALKSLAINDPASASIHVTYPSESTLARTLRSLSVDLTENPDIASMLGSLRGVEIDIYAPVLISGRIMGVERRPATSGGIGGGIGGDEAHLSLFTQSGVKTVALKDTLGFSFKDEKINADVNRALDLIMASRATGTRTLSILLGGENARGGEREVSLSYVIPAPVWKVSYRLDLSHDEPLLQGWAIVDNDSDMDWEGVELSLVTGRPVSFIQRLYAPYYLSRPVLPLAIAGVAEASAYNSGWTEAPAASPAPQMNMKTAEESQMAEAADSAYALSAAPRAAAGSAGGAGGAYAAVQTAAAQAAGDLFEFTIQKPVALARQQSAMLPLVEARIQAEKTLVFSGEKAMRRGFVNPSISAELTNTTGMKLPAGPITVYDGGTYAGDALINFFPENEKRLISYGDDLSVTGGVTSAYSRNVASVQASQGVMIINRKQAYERTYTIKNASGEEKRLVIEHPITSGAELADGLQFDERTDTVYRFARTLPAGGAVSFVVKEEAPIAERIFLSQMGLGSFVSYAADDALPEAARAALRKAVDLKRKADAAKTFLADCEKEIARLANEQSRIRQNLTAAGGQTPQGQEYLKKLSDLDASIDGQNAAMREAKTGAQSAQDEYDAYIAGLSL
jgi:hypothetical protein